MPLDQAGRLAATWRQRFARLVNLGLRVGIGGQHALLRPGYLEDFVADHRSGELQRRVRVLAALLAVATLLFVPLDLALLHGAGLRGLLPGRLVAVLAFAGLFGLAGRRATPRRAQLVLGGLVAVAVAFYAYAASIISLEALAAERTPIALESGYVFLPFLIVMLPALFPLTVGEALAMALPALLVQAGVSGGAGLVAETTGLALLWVLGLMAAMAVLSAVLQLNYLRASLLATSRDSLTGAMTRSAGLAMLAKLIAGVQRRGQGLALAYVDLDSFKAVNDGYGHAAGDAVLVRAGQALAAVLRQSDLLIRLGGEEFAIVLPETDAAGAETCLARLRAAGLGQRPDGRPLTVSIGVADTDHDGPDRETLLSAADGRMYQAKQAGRNRWVGPHTPATGIAMLPDAGEGESCDIA